MANLVQILEILANLEISAILVQILAVVTIPIPTPSPPPTTPTPTSSSGPNNPPSSHPKHHLGRLGARMEVGEWLWRGWRWGGICFFPLFYQQLHQTLVRTPSTPSPPSSSTRLPIIPMSWMRCRRGSGEGRGEGGKGGRGRGIIMMVTVLHKNKPSIPSSHHHIFIPERIILRRWVVLGRSGVIISNQVLLFLWRNWPIIILNQWLN